MENINFNSYKYSKNAKTTYKLSQNNDNDTDTDTVNEFNLPNTVTLSNGCYIKSKGFMKPCYAIGGSKKHITSLYKFETTENDFFFGDIKKDNHKFLVIAKISETTLDLFLFNNSNAYSNKFKCLEIIKMQISNN